MKFSTILAFGALATNVAACGGHGHPHHRDYKRSHDMAKRAIEKLDQEGERREHERRQLANGDQEELEKRQLLGPILTLLGLATTTTKKTTTTTTTTRKTTTTTTTTTTRKTTTTTTTAKPTTTTTTTTTKAPTTSSSTLSRSSTTSASSSSTTAKVSSSATTSSVINKPTTNSTSASNSTIPSAQFSSTILVVARDSTSARQATNGLNAYGIPFQVLLVPSTGAPLPALNSSATIGNFGGIIVVSGISYYYSSTDSWASGLTNDQWQAMYNYQLAFGVRMVQWDVYPQAAYGTTNLGSCCNSNVEQLIYFTNTTGFTQAGLKTGPGAALGSEGLWHYNTQITDPTTTWEIAQFAANAQFSNTSTAAVINNFAGREQMVFFIDWATDWSPTSNFLQHGYITWMTRGLYAGYRRVNFQTQIDDMMLPTGIYYPGNSNTTYRVTTDDMNVIKNWIPTVQAKMNKDSYYKVEVGFNGNGNLRAVDPLNQLGICNGGPIYVSYQTTSLEFQKPLGTGTDGWPTSPATYNYTSNCLNRDPLSVWWQTSSNRGNFQHISHTFTHEGEDNATYNDIYKEINWNQQWFKQTTIDQADFTANGLIPPAITGLHNGDAMRAWSDNGLTNCVGDNSRPLLRNQNNYMWPYITNMSADGFDGMTVIPRWSLRIYYNCDSQVCTTQQWEDSTGITGNFTDLMAAEKWDNQVRLLGLYHDGNMFHQLNLRSTNMPTYTAPDGTVVGSLLQAWVEQAVQEFNRLVNWPMITLKQADLATSFTNRMARDQCNYSMTYNVNNGGITGVTVGSANGNTCSTTVPVTFPLGSTVANTQGFQTEQIGNDPMTVWVKLSGSPVTFNLAAPVSLL